MKASPAEILCTPPRGRLLPIGWFPTALLGGLGVLALWSLTGYRGLANASDARLPISGTVAYQGQPLSSGTIEFVAQIVPVEVADECGAITVAIEDGRFEVPQRQGLVPGLYLAKIRTDSGVHAGRTSPEEEPLACVAPPSVPVRVKLEQREFILITVKKGRQHEYQFELVE